MEPKPSMVHNCSPPPGDELAKLGMRAGDVWICPVCDDNWRLRRGVQRGGMLPMSMQQPEWLRLNEPESSAGPAPDESGDPTP